MGSRLLQGVTPKLNYSQHWDSLLQPFLMEDAHPLIIRAQSTERLGLLLSGCALYLEVLASHVSRILAILMAFFVVLSVPQIKIRPLPLKGPGLCSHYSVVVIVDGPGFAYRQGQDVFLCFISSRPALLPTHFRG